MQSVISLQLLVGGPIAVADSPCSIGNRIGFYQNKELLKLNQQGFVGNLYLWIAGMYVVRYGLEC